VVKRVLNIVLSSWLAILLLFGTTAKEYIHLFTDHTDTVHTELHRDHIVIEPEHHHCTFLSFTIADFVSDASFMHHFPFQKINFPTYVPAVYQQLIPSIVSIRSLRGPPAI
jgi:hypothetical protein